MINADSILSMFTDRFTLLKYLQQLDGDVQKLLEKAVTSISVDKVPDTDDEYTLTINFEDGTSETTPAFVIEQGEDGRGISSIAKTGTTGNVDTYTITYTDGTTSTFTVTNATKKYKHKIQICSEAVGGPPEIGATGEVINDKADAYTISDFLAMTTNEFVAFLNSIKSSLNESIAPTGGFNITYVNDHGDVKAWQLLGVNTNDGSFNFSYTQPHALTSSWTVTDAVEEF